MPLFTQVRGRGILRSSFAGSCIDPPLRGARMASKALHAAWRRSTSCGGGWICREMNAPARAITLAAVLCTFLTHACSGTYIRQTRLHRAGPLRIGKPTAGPRRGMRGGRLKDVLIVLPRRARAHTSSQARVPKALARLCRAPWRDASRGYPWPLPPDTSSRHKVYPGRH